MLQSLFVGTWGEHWESVGGMVVVVLRVEVGVEPHGSPFFFLHNVCRNLNMAIYFFSSKNRLGKIFPLRRTIDSRVRLVSKAWRSHRTLCFATCTWAPLSKHLKINTTYSLSYSRYLRVGHTAVPFAANIDSSISLHNTTSTSS